MFFKYWKKRLAIWALNSPVMGFLRLLIFADMRFSIDQVPIEYQLNQIACNSFFHPELEFFFVLDFNVDYSKPMRLSFCHGLTTLQTQNLTIYDSVKGHVVLDFDDGRYLRLMTYFSGGN